MFEKSGVFLPSSFVSFYSSLYILQFSFAYFFCCVCVKYYVGIPYAKIIVFVFRLLCRRGSLVCSSETNRAADTLMS